MTSQLPESASDAVLESLAERISTPLYVYDVSSMLAQLTLIQESFPSFEISYAVKTNPNPSICRAFARAGATAGVSSTHEIEIALASGFGPGQLDYVSPGKDTASLAKALSRNVGLLSVESLSELSKLSTISASSASTGVLLRVNTRHRATEAGELMAGGSSAFGIDEEHIPSVLKWMDADINWQGFHTFPASQVLSTRFIKSHFQRVADMAVNLADRAGRELKTINYGGGFGVPYRESERPIDIRKLGASIEDGPAGRLSRGGVRSIVDVGRFLTAGGGTFLTRIVDVKTSRGANYVVVESGIGGFSRPAMHWAQPHGASILGRRANGGSESYSVVGPSCMPSDVLVQSVELERPKVGEIIAIPNAGAYGLSMSLLAWGGFAIPKEVSILPDGSCNVVTTSLRSSAESL